MVDYQNIKLEDLQRIVLLSAIISISLSFVYIINTPLASEYEVTIYSAFSSTFWFLFCSSILLTSMFILSYSYNCVGKKYILISFIIFFAGYTILFLLPRIHGYALFGRPYSDFHVHIAYTKEIIESNHIGKNWYPISHILLYLFNVLGFSYESGRGIISLILILLYSSFLFFYLRGVGGKSKYKYTPGFICSIPLVYLTFHVSFHPAIMSFFIFPTLLYILEKNKKSTNDVAWYNLLFILSIFLIFFHPMTSSLLIIFLIILYFSKKIYNNLEKCNAGLEYNLRYTFLILFASFFIWYSQFSRFSRNLKKVFLWSGQTTIAEKQMSSMGTYHLTPWQFIFRFFKFYGAPAIYIGLGLFCFLWFFKKLLSNKKLVFSEIHFSTQYLVGLLIGVIFISFYFVEQDLIRVSRYAVLASTLMIGFLLNKRIDVLSKPKDEKKSKIKGNKIVVIIIVALMLFSLILGLFNIYHRNEHLTYSEKDGTDWYIQNANLSKRSRSFRMDTRMVMYLEGKNLTKSEKKAFQRRNSNYQLPKHLGYADNETVAKTFDPGIYIITKAVDYNYYKGYYPNQRKILNYYTKKDVQKLEQDIGAHKVYSNGGYKVWQINNGG